MSAVVPLCPVCCVLVCVVAGGSSICVHAWACRRIKGMLSTLNSAEVSAEKREFMRLLQREKRRSTYLKAAKASIGRPQDALKARAAADRRLKSVAALQGSQHPPLNASSLTGATDAAAAFFAAAPASPGTY